jgi:hypothetical protein
MESTGLEQKKQSAGTKKKSFSKKSVLLSILALVVLIVLGLFLFNKNYLGNRAQKFDPNSVLVNQAKQGEILTEVPAGLIVDKAAVILGSSENVSQDSNTQTFVTSYKTNLSFDELQKGYIDFAANNGFNIISNSGKDEGYLSIFAASPEFDKNFSVTMTPSGSQQGSIIMIMFSKKK